jgi:hypothetical protein
VSDFLLIILDLLPLKISSPLLRFPNPLVLVFFLAPFSCLVVSFRLSWFEGFCILQIGYMLYRLQCCFDFLYAFLTRTSVSYTLFSSRISIRPCLRMFEDFHTRLRVAISYLEFICGPLSRQVAVPDRSLVALLLLPHCIHQWSN